MDTIVFIMPFPNYKVTEPERFKDPFHPVRPVTFEERIDFLNKHKGVIEYRQNPSIKLKEEGKYPNLTIYERVRGSAYSCDLHTSISLPKAVYGHSFKELNTDQLDETIDLLIKRLTNMGVTTTRQAILDSVVNTLHYAININFPTIEQARMFLTRMSKVSIGGWFEKNTKTYSNDGYAVRFHSKIFQLVFYLKYYDLFEDKSRSIDRSRTQQEIQIAEDLKRKGEIPPVVRMEVRMKGIRSVSSHLFAVAAKKQTRWTFKEVFNTKLSRQVLRYYWNKIIEDEINKSLLCSYTDEDICRLAEQKTKEDDLKEMFQSLGIFFSLRSTGVKDTRSLTVLRNSRPTWYRERLNLVKFLKNYAKPNDELIRIVTQAIDEVQLKID